MDFTVFEKFAEPFSKIKSEEERMMLSHAIIMYGLDIEDVDLSEFPIADALFCLMKEDIDNSKNKRKAGSNGGKKLASKQDKTDETSASKLASKLPSKLASEKKLSQTNTNQTNTNQTNTNQTKAEEGEKPPSLSIRCLNVFNRTFGTSYTTMPSRNAEYLNTLPKPPTDDDIRSMLEFKRKEWNGTKFKSSLTPNTLFSPDHFEQYLEQSKMQANEVSEYAAYD